LRTERSRTEGRRSATTTGWTSWPGPASCRPKLLALRARYQAPETAAFRHAIAARAPRDSTLLRLAYVDQVSLDAIGRMYGVNKSTVSRWLATCRAEVLAAACDHLRAALGIPAADVESLLGLMPRDLDVSLSGLLHA
jgi:RNA polymerase sigma-70 factor (ECF subfamily)